MVESKAAGALLRDLVVTGAPRAPAPRSPVPEATARGRARAGPLAGSCWQRSSAERPRLGGSRSRPRSRERRARRARPHPGPGRARRARARPPRRTAASERCRSRAPSSPRRVYDVESDRPMSDVDVLALERCAGRGGRPARGGLRGARARRPRVGLPRPRRARRRRAAPQRDLGARPLPARRGGAVGAPPRRPRPAAAAALRRRTCCCSSRCTRPSSTGSSSRSCSGSTSGACSSARRSTRSASSRSRPRPGPGPRSPRPSLVAEAVVAAPVPPALRSRLEGALPRGLRLARAAPCDRRSPSSRRPSPRLGRVRWELLAGRRAELVWRTARARETGGDERPPGPARLAAAVGRSVRLARGQLPAARAGPPAAARARARGRERPARRCRSARSSLRDCLASLPARAADRDRPLHGARASRTARRSASWAPRAAGRAWATSCWPGRRTGCACTGSCGARRSRPRAGAGARRPTAALLLDPPLDAADVLASVESRSRAGPGPPARVARALLSLAAGGIAARLRRGLPARARRRRRREPVRALDEAWAALGARSWAAGSATSYVLVPLAERGADLDSILNLSRVGAFIWEQLDGARDRRRTVVDAVVARFEVERAAARGRLPRARRHAPRAAGPGRRPDRPVASPRRRGSRRR